MRISTRRHGMDLCVQGGRTPFLSPPPLRVQEVRKPFICVPWLIHMCAMTQSYAYRDSLVYVRHDSSIYVWHDLFIYVMWLIHTCAMTSHPCVTWRIHMCDMAHPYVWDDSLICVTWLIHTCGTTHSYACHDSSICVPWLIHMRAMTHPSTKSSRSGKILKSQLAPQNHYMLDYIADFWDFCYILSENKNAPQNNHTVTTHVAPPRVNFCPGLAGCFRYVGTDLKLLHKITI